MYMLPVKQPVADSIRYLRSRGESVGYTVADAPSLLFASNLSQVFPDPG